MRSPEQALRRPRSIQSTRLIHDLDDIFLGEKLAGHEKPLFDGATAFDELNASSDVKAYGMGINKGETLQNDGHTGRCRFRTSRTPDTLLDLASLDTGIACVKRGVSVIYCPRALCLGHSRDWLAGQR
jgi:hypothetical protein